MISLLTVCLFLISFFCIPASSIAATENARMIPENFSGLAEMVGPVVVNIRTVKIIKGGGRVFRQFGGGEGSPFDQNGPMPDFFEKFFGQNQEKDFKQRSLGSGFVIDKEGYIVTNNHVIEGADEIKVIFKDENEYDAEIVGRDPNTDLALIKIKSPDNLPVAKIGNSDKLKVGEWVVAIGSPFGLEQTVTAGIVSAKGRVIGSGPYDDFIQTDASINPGNSGGPLINMKGEVIGINTAIVASGQGIGFAIPINMASNIIEQLKDNGEVTRGWLGVAIQNLTDELAEYYGVEDKKGVLVTEVFPGDPADKAGIQAKDIIVSIDGKKVSDTRELTSLIAGIGVGEKIDIDIVRNGKLKTYKVKIAKRDDGQIVSKGRNDTEKDELGIRVSALTPEMAQQYKIPESEGVIVREVQPDSKGAKAGIMTGDIIKEINHENVTNVETYQEAIDKVKDGESINMFIRRANSGFIVIKLTK
ncbi:MAG: DegQ family serine endoprotease [Desulfobacterales bacterium]|nr:DegQ family serine endoprotease [Desulfobacterales bacterium]